jgi:5-methyltetrahydropteroyltriglutamate--homocysteine methyltransferase
VGDPIDEAAYEQELRAAVVDLVRRQKEAGIDLVNDGEYGHTMGYAYDYGAWWSYVFPRLKGLELVKMEVWDVPQHREAEPGEVVLGSFNDRRDWQQFGEAYADPATGSTTSHRWSRARSPIRVRRAWRVTLSTSRRGSRPPGSRRAG